MTTPLSERCATFEIKENIEIGLIWFKSRREYTKTMCALELSTNHRKMDYREWSKWANLKLKESSKEGISLAVCSPDLGQFHEWCESNPNATLKEKYTRLLLLLV